MLTENLIVLVICYNHEQSISKCIDSILDQNTRYPIKIICFDDCSNDRSLEILKKYEKKYQKKITVFSSETNLGTGKQQIIKNMNKFRSNSKYWAVIDGDDWWIDKNKVNEQIKILENNDNYIGCAGITRVVNEHDNEIGLIKQTVVSANLKGHIFKVGKGGLYAHPSSIIWKNIYYKNENFFLPIKTWKKIYGDAAIAHLMLNNNKNKKIYFLNKILSQYNFNKKGVWSSLSDEERKKANDNVYKNYIKVVSIHYKIIIFFKFWLISLIKKIKLSNDKN
jgi:glycosyltransferase involved in cell wall biosynthesis